MLPAEAPRRTVDRRRRFMVVVVVDMDSNNTEIGTSKTRTKAIPCSSSNSSNRQKLKNRYLPAGRNTSILHRVNRIITTALMIPRRGIAL